MFIYGSNGFSKVSVHLRVSNIKFDIIIVDDPWKYWILGQVVVGSVGLDVNEIQVLHVGDLPTCPHAHNICQLNLHDFLTPLIQVPIHHLPTCLLIKDKQNRILIIVEP